MPIRHYNNSTHTCVGPGENDFIKPVTTSHALKVLIAGSCSRFPGNFRLIASVPRCMHYLTSVAITISLRVFPGSCTEQPSVRSYQRHLGQDRGDWSAGVGRRRCLRTDGLHAVQRTHARDVPSRQEVAQAGWYESPALFFFFFRYCCNRSTGKMSSSYSSLDLVLSHWAHFTVHRFICVCVYLCFFLFHTA